MKFNAFVSKEEQIHASCEMTGKFAPLIKQILFSLSLGSFLLRKIAVLNWVSSLGSKESVNYWSKPNPMKRGKFENGNTGC